jgi:serine/threonine protein kinase
MYMPPEIVKQSNYDAKVDVWSAGVITFILLVGKPPFLAKNKTDLYKLILDEPPSSTEKDWENLSKSAR